MIKRLIVIKLIKNKNNKVFSINKTMSRYLFSLKSNHMIKELKKINE